MELERVVNDFAACISTIDARRPVASNARSGVAYQPGIGPHPEAAAVTLIAAELPAMHPDLYAHGVHTGVRYPAERRQRCDVCLGTEPNWEWAIEVKLLRLLGDNGKLNDQMLTHLLPHTRSTGARSPIATS